MRVTQMEAAGASLKRSAAAGSRALPLLVLIDNGDGTAEVMARRLKASGDSRYAILAGGELVLSRNGQSGLQRSGSRATLGPRGAVGLGATP